MANLDFPATPSIGQQYTSPNDSTRVWEYNGESWIAVSQALNSGNTEILGTTFVSSNTDQQAIDTYVATSYRSAKYLIEAVSGTDYHFSEINLTHDGTNVYETKFGDVFDNVVLATYSTDINGGSVRLLATPVNAVTTFKINKTYFKV